MRYSIESLRSLFIEMYFNCTLLASGTGFILKSSTGEPYLVTNRHNVTGRHNETNKPLDEEYGAIPNRIEISHHKKGVLGEVVVRSERLYRDDDFLSPLWAEHPSFKGKVDFVALKLTNLEDVDIYDYDLEKDNDVQIRVADVISVIGFPFGLQIGKSLAVWATGFIASEPDLDYNDLPLFFIDCRSRQGQSGSAVVAYRPIGMVYQGEGDSIMYSSPSTKFLGIYSGRIDKESDIGMVWKASSIKELMDGIK